MIQQEISEYITELLYKHDRLSIPGLGSLILEHAPANLDQIQGQISAPSKQIKFNENLVMDDGLLMNYIMKRKNWPIEQCQTWIKNQVETLKEALERREIVELTGLGRFFKNFEHQLQFVAESTNYNTDSFGLEPVLAQAVNRSLEDRTPLVTSLQDAAARKKPKTNKKEYTDWLRKNAWWLILSSLILITLMSVLWMLQSKKATPVVTDPAVPVERLNTSPSKNIEQQPPEDITVDSTEDLVEEPVREEPIQDEQLDTMEPTVLPDEHTAIIAVGLFKEQENVQNILEDLNKKGFSAVTQKEGNFTRVGVSIRFQEESELQKVLREVRRKYTKSAFVMFRNGVKVK